MTDKGAKTGGKGVRIGRERGTMRMGWTRMRVMTTGGATEAWAWLDHGNSDNKMARKTTKERAGRRGWA